MSSRNKINLEPAWILHSRSFQESSLLLEVFTRNHGRIGLIARGARRSRKGRQGLLQPFSPLLCSWVSRGELGSLSEVERATGQQSGLPRALIASGFYLNELIFRLLARNDPHPNLFQTYQNTLAGLRVEGRLQQSLRCFERDLLSELGYALQLGDEAGDGPPVEAGQLYNYQIENGPRAAQRGSNSPLCVHGDTLLALQAGRFETLEQQREAREMMAAVIKHYLGGEEPRSRALLKMEWK